MSYDAIGRRLALAHKATHEWVDAVLVEHGSSLTNWIVLLHAADAETPGLSQRALADNLSIGGPALVRHLDRLEAQGFLRRTRDAQDRRVMRITLTSKGRRHLDELRAVMAGVDADLRGALTAKEQQILERALMKVQAHALAALTENRGAGLAADETGVA